MYEETSKKSIFKTIFAAIFYGIFIFIMCSFIINSCKMSDTDIADDVIFDDTTTAVYEADKEGFEVYSYDIEKRFESVGANKLLQLKYFYYIPEAKQMQLTIKYSTSYASAPTDEALPFEIALKDNNGINIDDYFYESDEKQGYGYIRICWNGVEFTDKSEYVLYITPVENDEKTFLMQKAGTASKLLKLDKKNAPYIFGK